MCQHRCYYRRQMKLLWVFLGPRKTAKGPRKARREGGFGVKEYWTTPKYLPVRPGSQTGPKRGPHLGAASPNQAQTPLPTTMNVTKQVLVHARRGQACEQAGKAEQGFYRKSSEISLRTTSQRKETDKKRKKASQVCICAKASIHMCRGQNYCYDKVV